MKVLILNESPHKTGTPTRRSPSWRRRWPRRAWKASVYGSATSRYTVHRMREVRRDGPLYFHR